jgi:acyl dehydratase
MLDDETSQLFYFEDYTVGLEKRSITYTADKDEAIAFARQWDPQPFHIDERAAKKSLFGGLTCCSAQIFAIFCTISQQWESGEVQQAIASLGFDKMRMLKPVYVGDTLVNVSTVEQARLSSSHPGTGIVRSRCQMFNQRDEEVFRIEAAFLIQGRTAPAS